MWNNLEKRKEGDYNVTPLDTQNMYIGVGDEYCMMMKLNEPIDGVEVIPMGYWITPDIEELETNELESHWIIIDPIAEFWVINGGIYWHYDAAIGTVVYEANGGKFLGH